MNQLSNLDSTHDSWGNHRFRDSPGDVDGENGELAWDDRVAQNRTDGERVLKPFLDRLQLPRLQLKKKNNIKKLITKKIIIIIRLEMKITFFF
jgi:hypothetical protein